jgi:hypothetical protein
MLQPACRRSIISNRPRAVVRAFSWLSIRGSELLGVGIATTANQLSSGGTTSIAATTSRARSAASRCLGGQRPYGRRYHSSLPTKAAYAVAQHPICAARNRANRVNRSQGEEL